ncbi:MAG: uroporphyrinogen-III synthase [Anaerolineales bacterium]
MSERRPLEGLRILVTRPADRARSLLLRLEELGATPIAFPTIRIEPRRDLSPLDAALKRLESYDWVVFTSVHAVEITWDRLTAGVSLQETMRGRRLAAIGPATAAALHRRGMEPTFVPEEFVAERVAEGLGEVNGLRILLPRAEGARAVLPQELTRRGAQVEEIPLYRAVPAEPEAQALAWIKLGVNVVTFTSPSTVRGFGTILERLGLDPLRLPGDPVCACIGPVTATAAAEAGYRSTLVAKVYTADGLVEALREHFERKPRHASHRR